MKKLLHFFGFIFLLLLHSHTFAQTQQYDDKRIAKIDIITQNTASQQSIETKSIVTRLKSKEGDLFSQYQFDDDLKTLAMEFDQIEPVLRLQNNEVYITITVQPRPIIKSIIWKGDFSQKKSKLEQELNLLPASTFNRQEFQKALYRLKEFYIKKGYFEADIEYKLVHDRPENEVTIEIIIHQGRCGKIASIVFQNFDKEAASQLKKEMHTKTFFPLTSWYTGTGTYREEALEFDKIAILHYLQNQGYADAKITIIIEPSQKQDRIDLIIQADKGEKYYFGPISFTGNHRMSDEVIQRLLKIHENEPYSPTKLQETVRDITNYYGKAGYIDATVSYQPHLEEDKPVYSIHFNIHEGSEYKVGLIKVLGNNSTHAKVILHESLLVPGSVFDTRKLDATEKRLSNVGYFKSTNVYASSTTSSTAFSEPLRDVNIEVEETNTGNFGVSFGFSTLSNIFGGLEITERNFNAMGFGRLFQDGLFSMRGGGEYLRLKATWGQGLIDYAFSWTKPYFLDSNWTVGFNINNNISRLQSDDYDIKTFSTTVNAFYSINQFLSFECHYRLKNLKMKVDGGSPPLMQDEAKNDGIISSVGMALLYNSTNHPYRATQGFLSNLAIDFAGVGGRYTFFKLAYDNAYYQPLIARFISKTRADFNFILPFGSTTPDIIPVGERYFMGGENTVRGYQSFIIGPRYNKRNPRGGISSVLLSEEILVNVLQKPNLDLFAFFDAGSNSLERFNVDVLRASAGFGIRLEILANIPLTFGWGFPLNPEFREDKHIPFFSMGGKF